MEEILKELGCEAIAVEVMPDHVHVFALCPPRFSPAYIVNYLKGKSARKDQYRIGGNKLILKGLGAIGRIELGYKGLIHLKGEQCRLEIHYSGKEKVVCIHSIRNLGESC